jgi:acrylyl-CoA reductase (NADPH)
MFKALMLTRDAERRTHAALESIDEAALRAADPEGQVLVRVSHSALNYKDALAITGKGDIARKWPMVAGIDLAGTVERSEVPQWQPGDEVVVTGLGLSETHWGGLAQKAWAPASWLFRRPAKFDARRAMGVATAGVTAALCVAKLQAHGLQPGDGQVLVTGAAGGVGSIALALLASLGFHAVASTGRPQEQAYLERLGAREIVDRASLSAPGKPLQSERWAAVIDSVGSHTLVNASAQTRPNGAVAACGLAQGPDLPATVLPFILRGVTLYGVNSIYIDETRRRAAWALLDQHLDLALLDGLCVEIGLTEAIAYAPRLLAGEVRGRTIVDVQR